MIVCFTVNNRPQYLRETLESWSKARGADDMVFYFRCEPGCAQAVDVCDDFLRDHAGVVAVNPQRYGVLGNPWAALEMAFGPADDPGDFVILAEEDLIVSPDVLEFFTWCQRYRDDPDVLGVSTHRHFAGPGRLGGTSLTDWPDPGLWHFWVWGLWRDRWDLIRDDWDFTYRENGGGPSCRGWDWRLRNVWVRGKGMKVVVPDMARSQHIGQFGGAHCSPDQFEALLSKCFAGLDVPPQDYQEVA